MVVLLVAASLAATLPATAVDSPQVAIASPDQVWSQSVRLIESGDFAGAARHADELERLGPRGSLMAEWLRAQQEMATTRVEMTQADYQRYVDWAQEQRAKGKIQWALDYCVQAYNNCRDQEAFRQQEWLKELYDEALVHAESLRNEQEWLDAHAIYYQLAAVHEQDPLLKKLKRECLTHARLELFYEPDSNWEEQLAGIQWRMATDAIWKIENYYVTEADFRKWTISGLEQLLLLAQSPALQEVFPALANEFDRQDFVNRLEKRISLARANDRISRSKAEKLFRRALEINTDTVELPEPVVVSEFMAGAMETLDEFSTVIWPVEFREFDKRTQGEFVGVGISISKPQGTDGIRVVTPMEDAPAYYAGVLADDLIIEVNGKPTKDMSLTKAVETITGPEGTSVTLTVRRKVEGVDKEISFRLKREVVTIQSVKGCRRDADDPQKWDYMIDPDLGIGYVRLTTFDGKTVAQLQSIISDLQQTSGLKGLILDLRSNPGGLLKAAVGVTELFLSRNDKVVSTKGERWPEQVIPVQRTGPFVDLPLVVLINGGSASASEIVCGALQDHHRAKIIGERTFGKFSVQNLMQLRATDGHLKLTTAAYYLPSGKSLHRTDDSTEWGVDPDIQVALVPKEVYKLWEMRRDVDVIRPTGWEPGEDEPADATDALPDQPGAVEIDFGPMTIEGDDTTEEGASGDAKPGEPKPETGEAKGEGDAGDEADEEEEESLPPDPNERPKIDPQLDTALLVMRVQLIDDGLTQMASRTRSAELKTE